MGKSPFDDLTDPGMTAGADPFDGLVAPTAGAFGQLGDFDPAEPDSPEKQAAFKSLTLQTRNEIDALQGRATDEGAWLNIPDAATKPIPFPTEEEFKAVETETGKPEQRAVKQRAEVRSLGMMRKMIDQAESEPDQLKEAIRAGTAQFRDPEDALLWVGQTVGMIPHPLTKGISIATGFMADNLRMDRARVKDDMLREIRAAEAEGKELTSVQAWFKKAMVVEHFTPTSLGRIVGEGLRNIGPYAGSIAAMNALFATKVVQAMKIPLTIAKGTPFWTKVGYKAAEMGVRGTARALGRPLNIVAQAVELHTPKVKNIIKDPEVEQFAVEYQPGFNWLQSYLRSAGMDIAEQVSEESSWILDDVLGAVWRKTGITQALIKGSANKPFVKFLDRFGAAILVNKYGPALRQFATSVSRGSVGGEWFEEFINKVPQALLAGEQKPFSGINPFTPEGLEFHLSTLAVMGISQPLFGVTAFGTSLSQNKGFQKWAAKVGPIDLKVVESKAVAPLEAAEGTLKTLKRDRATAESRPMPEGLNAEQQKRFEIFRQQEIMAIDTYIEQVSGVLKTAAEANTAGDKKALRAAELDAARVLGITLDYKGQPYDRWGLEMMDEDGDVVRRDMFDTQEEAEEVKRWHQDINRKFLASVEAAKQAPAPEAEVAPEPTPGAEPAAPTPKSEAETAKPAPKYEKLTGRARVVPASPTMPGGDVGLIGRRGDEYDVMTDQGVMRVPVGELRSLRTYGKLNMPESPDLHGAEVEVLGDEGPNRYKVDVPGKGQMIAAKAEVTGIQEREVPFEPTQGPAAGAAEVPPPSSIQPTQEPTPPAGPSADKAARLAEAKRVRAGKAKPKAPAQAEKPAAPVQEPGVEPGTVHRMALAEQRKAGWNPDWPFIPADMNNADFRALVERDPVTSAEEKVRIFSAGERLGVVPIGEAKLVAQRLGVPPAKVEGGPGQGVETKPAMDEATGLPLNPDGTVTLYHGTTKDAGPGIVASGKLKSAAEPDVYLTTDPKGGGYGDGTVVAVDVRPSQLKLDDEFPDGRKDFRINAGKPGGEVAVNKVTQTSPVTSEKPGGGPQPSPARTTTEETAPVAEPRKPITGKRGSDFVSYDADQNPVEGHVQLVEADQVEPSHLFGDDQLVKRGEGPAVAPPNPKYDIPELQNRAGAGDLHSQEIVRGLRDKPNPVTLTSTVGVTEGVPWTDDTGRALNNHRLAGLTEGARANTPGYQAYRQYLSDNAEKFGMTKEDVDKMERPILVRVPNAAMNRKELVDFALTGNRPGTRPHQEAEKAMNYGRLMRENADAVLSKFNPESDLMSENNAEFRQSFYELVSPEDRTTYFTGLQLNGTGERAATLSLLASAWTKSNADFDIFQRLVVAKDDNIRALGLALERLGAQFGRLNGLAEAGTRRPLSLVDDVPPAARALSTIRTDRKESVEQFIRRTPMLEPELTAASKMVLALADRAGKSSAPIYDVLKRYGDMWEAQGDPSQSALDFEPPPSREAMLQKALRDAASPTNANATLTPKDAEEIIALSQKQPSKSEADRFAATWYGPQPRVADPFYLKSRRLVERSKQGAAPARQWSAYLKDVKADERKWTGLDDLLKDPNRKLTKQEILDYIDQNAVKVEEVERGGMHIANERRYRAAEHLQTNAILKLKESLMAAGVPEDEAVEKARGIALNANRANYKDWLIGIPGSPELDAAAGNAVFQTERTRWMGADYNRVQNLDTKYESYQLPGGQNYRELLMTMPIAPSVGKFDAFVREMARKYGVEARNPGEASVLYHTKLADAERAKWDELGEPSAADRIRADEAGKTYTSSHWSEPNVLVHLRFNERTDAQGKKVLFIEEIQSDWHQAGREQGYQGTRNITKLPDGWKVEERSWATDPESVNDRFYVGDERGVPQSSGANPEQAIANTLRYLNNRDAVPPAPFSETWHELAFKRAVRWAAEHGFDRVAWTTGEQQADRYQKLLKDVTEVTYRRDGDGYKVIVHARTGRPVHEGWHSKSELKGVVGKQVALDMDAEKGEAYKGNFSNANPQVNGVPWHRLSYPSGLTIGGEGFREFYDQKIGGFADKLSRKFGGKGTERVEVPTQSVEEVYEGEEGVNGEVFGRVTRPTGETHNITVPAIDITPEMRQSVMQEGQSMFAARASIDPAKFYNVNTELGRFHDQPYDSPEAARAAITVSKDIASKYGQRQAIVPGAERAVRSEFLDPEGKPAIRTVRGDEVQKMMDAKTIAWKPVDQLFDLRYQATGTGEAKPGDMFYDNERAAKQTGLFDQAITPPQAVEPADVASRLPLPVLEAGFKGIELFRGRGVRASAAHLPHGAFLWNVLDDEDFAFLLEKAKVNREELEHVRELARNGANPNYGAEASCAVGTTPDGQPFFQLRTTDDTTVGAVVHEICEAAAELGLAGTRGLSPHDYGNLQRGRFERGEVTVDQVLAEIESKGPQSPPAAKPGELFASMAKDFGITEAEAKRQYEAVKLVRDEQVKSIVDSRESKPLTASQVIARMKRGDFPYITHGYSDKSHFLDGSWASSKTMLGLYRTEKAYRPSGSSIHSPWTLPETTPEQERAAVNRSIHPEGRFTPANFPSNAGQTYDEWVAKGRLLAPNGQPSKLNERQWRQVRTPAFKAWFGPATTSAAIDHLLGGLTAQMQSGVFGRIQESQILNSIVEAIPVDVVNNLGGQERMAQVLLHDPAMLADALVASPDAIDGFYAAAGSVVAVTRTKLHNSKPTAANAEMFAALDALQNNLTFVARRLTSRASTGANLRGQSIRHQSYLDGLATAGVGAAPIDVAAGAKDLSADQARNVQQGALRGRLAGLSAEVSPMRPESGGLDKEGLAAKVALNVHDYDYTASQAEGQELSSFSKVVDENGEPLVVYHGTRRNFTEFSRRKIGTGADYYSGMGDVGDGFYFAPEASYADIYALTRKQEMGKGSQIIPVFLNVRNPISINKLTTDPEYDGIAGALQDPYPGETVSGKLREMGSDGITGIDGDEIVVFDPTQIKSALSNRGTFDAGNADIRFAAHPKSLDDMNADELDAEIKRLEAEIAAEQGITPESLAEGVATEEAKAVPTGAVAPGFYRSVSKGDIPIADMATQHIRNAINNINSGGEVGRDAEVAKLQDELDRREAQREANRAVELGVDDVAKRSAELLRQTGGEPQPPEPAQRGQAGQFMHDALRVTVYPTANFYSQAAMFDGELGPYSTAMWDAVEEAQRGTARWHRWLTEIYYGALGVVKPDEASGLRKRIAERRFLRHMNSQVVVTLPPDVIARGVGSHERLENIRMTVDQLLYFRWAVKDAENAKEFADLAKSGELAWTVSGSANAPILLDEKALAAIVDAANMPDLPGADMIDKWATDIQQMKRPLREKITEAHDENRIHISEDDAAVHIPRFRDMRYAQVGRAELEAVEKIGLSPFDVSEMGRDLRWNVAGQARLKSRKPGSPIPFVNRGIIDALRSMGEQTAEYIGKRIPAERMKVLTRHPDFVAAVHTYVGRGSEMLGDMDRLINFVEHPKHSPRSTAERLGISATRRSISGVVTWKSWVSLMQAVSIGNAWAVMTSAEREGLAWSLSHPFLGDFRVDRYMAKFWNQNAALYERFKARGVNPAQVASSLPLPSVTQRAVSGVRGVADWVSYAMREAGGEPIRFVDEVTIVNLVRAVDHAMRNAPESRGLTEDQVNKRIADRAMRIINRSQMSHDEFSAPLLALQGRSEYVPMVAAMLKSEQLKAAGELASMERSYHLGQIDLKERARRAYAFTFHNALMVNLLRWSLRFMLMAAGGLLAGKTFDQILAEWQKRRPWQWLAMMTGVQAVTAPIPIAGEFVLQAMDRVTRLILKMPAMESSPFSTPATDAYDDMGRGGTQMARGALGILRGDDDGRGGTNISTGFLRFSLGASVMAGEGLLPGVYTQYREVKAGYGHGAENDRVSAMRTRIDSMVDRAEAIYRKEGMTRAYQWFTSPENAKFISEYDATRRALSQKERKRLDLPNGGDGIGWGWASGLIKGRIKRDKEKSGQ